MDASGEWVLSMATASPGVLVSAPAMSPTTLGVSMSKGIFQPRCREGGGADNEQGDDDEGLPFAPEGVEELGSRLYADGEDEQYESEVTQLLGDDDAEMPEQQGDENNGRYVE